MITPKIILSGAAADVRENGLAQGVYRELLYDEQEQPTGKYRHCMLGAMRTVAFGSHLLPKVSEFDETMSAYQEAERILAEGLIGKRGVVPKEFIVRWSDSHNAEQAAEVLEAAAEIAP